MMRFVCAMLKFILALVLGSSFAARAQDPEECDRRMTYDMAGLVEMAVDRQFITLDVAKRLAVSERPFNPLAGAPPRIEQQRVRLVFEQYMNLDDARWQLERQKIGAMLARTAGAHDLRDEARKDTAKILNPQIVATRKLEHGGSHYVLPTADGRVVYSQREGDLVEIRELFSGKLLHSENMKSKVYEMRLHPESGDPEMRIMRTFDPSLKDWGSAWRTRGYYARTINFRTGWTGERSVGIIKPSQDQQMNDWRKAGRSLNGDQEFRASDGKIYRSSVGFKNPMELVVTEGKSETVVMKTRIPDFNVRMRFFEQDGELFLMLDQASGPTTLYKPIESDVPLYSLDLSAWRDYLLYYVHRPDGQNLFVGFKGETANIISPFTEKK